MGNKYLFILFTTVLITFSMIANAQEAAQEVAQEKDPVDTLVYLGGKHEPVNIANITTSKVFYTNLEDDTIFEIERKQIEKIIYRTGRVEVLNRPVFEMISEDDWRHVFLTEDPEEIQGLYERGPIEVTAAASRNRRATIRNAEIRLKRQAASLGANMILLQSTEFRGGFGDIPSITMKGIAYGFMPLPEEETQDPD